VKNVIAFLFVFLLSSQISFGQNWAGIHDGQDNIYDNGQTMLIASIDTVAGNPVYRFCQDVGNSAQCDSIPVPPFGGISYLAKIPRLLGASFTKFSNGDEIYRNAIFENILIKNLATLNETWMIMTDSNGIEYRATITLIDTLAILGNVDSIKQISIQAFNGANPIASPYNVTLELSKHNGFIKVFSFAKFPYDTTVTISNFVMHSQTPKANKIYPSKYNAGNEWMTSLSYDSNLVSYIWYQSDSIISSSYNALTNAVTFSSQRKNLFKLVNPDSIISASNLLIQDTISLPNYYSSSQQCNQGFNFGINYGFYNQIITCNLDTLQTYFSNSSGSFGCFITSTQMPEPCVEIFCSIESSPNSWSINKVEGFGITYADNYDEYGFSYVFDTYYYNVNGCPVGNKFLINFPTDADLFELHIQQENENTLKLNWFTINEHDVNYFEIERSYDAIHFTKIGNQMSKGDNAQRNEYEFIDYSLIQNAKVFYRIKMMDIDGKVKYSNVVNYQLSEVGNIHLQSNQINQSITIEGLKLNHKYELSIQNVQGQTIKSVKAIHCNSLFTLNDLDALSDGIYFLSVKSIDSNERQVFKFLKY
jgi:hypothetical protein